MNYNRFMLEPYKGKATRYCCPSCNKPASFARYIDTETGEHLHPNAGRCNRESSCGYHYPPRQFYMDNPSETEIHLQATQVKRKQPKPEPLQQISTVPPDVFKQSLQAHTSNNFVNYLISLFGAEYTKQLIGRYYIGTSKHWGGATVFYQIDTKGRIRSGKIMLYNRETGKRVKEPFSHLTWVHSALDLPEYHLQQCFFGEHLLKVEPLKPVALVESEKTAIIASAYLPGYIWLATGGKGGLSADRCKVLRGRKVILYPDLNAFDEWSEKANELAGVTTIAVSDLLERKATEAEKEQGLDLADYLTRFSYSEIKVTPVLELPHREFYHCSFQELTDLLGQDVAMQKVIQYQALSKQFSACSTFVVHTCKLLSTYQQAVLKQAS